MSKKKQKTVPSRPTQQITIPPPNNKNLWKTNILVFFVLAGISLIIYANSLSNQFVFDDLPIVVENPLIKNFRYIPLIIGLQNGRPMYRPVRYITYMVDYALSGLQPTAYHVSNCLYHAVTAFILFLLLRALTTQFYVAATGALLFLTHPVATDSVTYISGRRDILVALFYVLAFYYFVRFRTAPRKWHPVVIIACFILALGSKEMAVTLPLVCLLYDFICSMSGIKTQPAATGKNIVGAVAAMFKLYWKLYVPLGILGGLFFYDKIFVHYPSLVKNFYGGSAASNFATVLRILCHYIKLMLFPVVLHADYSYNSFPLSESFLELRVVVAVLLLAACLWLIVGSLRKQVWIFFGGMWFFITLLPVCQIFPHHELMAEHYLYLPLIGFIILFSPLWQYLLQKRKTRAQVIIITLLLLFSVRTIARNRDWKDPMTLWTSVLRAAPQCARAHDNVGTEYLKLNDTKTALTHYQQAVRLRPEHAIFHNNLGRAYGMLGDIQNAQAELEKAVSLNPVLAEAYNNLGIAYYQKGDFKKAAELFWKSAALKPAHMVSYNYAKAVLKMGAMDEAIRAFEQAIRLKPDYFEAYQELGLTYWGKGDSKKSQAYLQKALAVTGDPEQRQRIEKVLEYVRKNAK